MILGDTGTLLRRPENLKNNGIFEAVLYMKCSFAKILL
jgi:hypothetical protein